VSRKVPKERVEKILGSASSLISGQTQHTSPLLKFSLQPPFLWQGPQTLGKRGRIPTPDRVKETG
jgi:hypothetical protein